MKQRILVVGGLAAGPSAASKAKRVNPNAEVILFEQGEHISYGICEIPYFIGGVFSDPDDLVAYTPDRLRREKGVDAKTYHLVETIDAVKKRLAIRDLQKDRVGEYSYNKLILATGSVPNRLDIDGEDARNVFHIKSLHHAFALKKYLDDERPIRAVIVGGGYIGMEMAEALRHRGLETTVLHRRDLPMSGLEEETRRAVKRELEEHGVKFVARTETRALRLDSSNRVMEVVTSTGVYPADVVILSLGVRPNTSLARSARIRLGTKNGILTDQRQTTSIDSIYAAGDCCEVKHRVTNGWSYIPLATTASKQGWVAGENAAGGNAVFKGTIRAIAVKVFRLEVAQVGISSHEARTAGFDVVAEQITANSRIAFMPGNAKLHLTLVADRRSRRILGANMYGEDGAVLRANTVGVAIQHQLTIDELAQLDLIYTPPYSPLWDPILVGANQLRKKVE
jgi:NADPH-dependent 2,4-dienoyl-CoA reductase/sulfur reductase-like enzyme